MKNPNPIPFVLSSIFSGGLGFMLFGIWLGEKISHDERILLWIGISFIVSSVGFAIWSSKLARNQGRYDMEVIPPNSKL